MTKCSITIAEGEDKAYAVMTLESSEKVRELYNNKELAHAFVYRLLEAFIRQIDKPKK